MESIAERCDSSLFAYAGLISCLLSIGFTLWAIFPYLSKRNPCNDSVLYFGNVSNYSQNIFKKIYDEMTEDNLYEDYLRQVQVLPNPNVQQNIEYLQQNATGYKPYRK